jgi:triacylglycerol lipase
VSRLGLAGKVASLTTVGTPHRGTPLADLGANLGRAARVFSTLQRFGVDVEAFHDLTSQRMAAFNREVPDARCVMYASVVGAPPRRTDVTPVLLPSWVWLSGEGENDGMVPVVSQRWGDVVFEIGADHFAQIGWSRRFDAAEFYAELLRELRARGM